MGYRENPGASKPILPRMAAGDSEAMDDCLRHYGNLVRFLARRMSFDESEAEDAVQEIFIDLWKSAGRFDPDRAPESVFVKTIARRRLIDRQRHWHRKPTFEPFTESFPNQEARYPEAVSRLELSRLEETLKDLPPDRRRVVILAVIQGLTHSEIAKSTGLPLGTVKSHIRRGLRNVQDLLGLPRPMRQR